MFHLDWQQSDDFDCFHSPFSPRLDCSRLAQHQQDIIQLNAPMDNTLLGAIAKAPVNSLVN